MVYGGRRDCEKCYLDLERRRRRNVKTAGLTCDMLHWPNSLCVSIILPKATVSRAISTPSKAVKDPMGKKH